MGHVRLRGHRRPRAEEAAARSLSWRSPVRRRRRAR
jgi:hypothetical protein